MTEDLGSISVGLKVGLGNLHKDLDSIKAKIKPLEAEHLIPFKVGKVTFDAVRRDLDAIAKKAIPISLTATANSGRLIHKELTSQLKAAGPVKVMVSAHLSKAEVNRIRSEITTALRQAGGVNVPLTSTGGGGAAGGGTPVRPQRGSRVLQGAPAGGRVAAGPGSAVAEPPARPARRGRTAAEAHAAVATPPAAEPEVSPRPARTRRAAAPAEEAAAERPATRTGRARAATAPAEEAAAEPAARPVRPRRARAAAAPVPALDVVEPWEDFDEGGVGLRRVEPRRLRANKPHFAIPQYPENKPPGDQGINFISGAGDSGVNPRTGKRVPVAPLTYRATPEGGVTTKPPVIEASGPARSLNRRVNRAASKGRKVSADTIKAESALVRRPETDEEIEYAERQTQVRVPMTLGEADFEGEKGRRGRGVRGARRSGAREPGEKVLLPTDVLARDIQRDDLEDQVRAARNEELVKPARGSRAFYGRTSPSHAGFRARVDKLKFRSIDPTLAEAYDFALEGETDKARAAMRGFYPKLAGGGDPQLRKKFFKLYDNVQDVPEEMLEQHAAIQSLFYDVGKQESDERVASADAALKALKPTKDENPTQWEALLSQRRSALDWQSAFLRGLTRREGGGRVGRTLRLSTSGPWGDDEGDPSSLVGAFPGLSIDLPRFKDEERVGEAIKAFQHDFPVSASKLTGIFTSRLLGDRTMGETRQVLNLNDVPLMGDRLGLQRQSHKRNQEIAINPLLLQEGALEGLETGTTADRLGVPAVFEHELGHVVDAANQRLLSGVAASSPTASPYAKYSPLESAAELFSARRFIRGFKGTEDRDFFEMLDRLSQRERGSVGREGGGPVKGGLMARIAAAQAARKNAYLVGEKKPEAYISDSGRVEIVGENGPEIRTFDEGGEILPYVPEWIRRGMAKDLTNQREPGGRVEKKVREFGGDLAAEPFSGLGRTARGGGSFKRIREGFEGERELIAKGGLSPSGGVQRVFVVNFPGGGGGGGSDRLTTAPRGQQRAAAPSGADPVVKLEKTVASFAKLMRDTVKVRPTKPEDETSVGPGADALQKFEARAAAEGGSTRLFRDQLTNLRSRVSTEVSQNPQRSLAPAVGQIFASIAGRGELTKRVNVAQEAVAKATKQIGRQEVAEANLTNTQTALTKAEDAGAKNTVRLTKARDDAQKILTKQTKATREAFQAAEKAADATASLSLKARVFTANTLGIIGGTLLFGATLGVAQAGIEAVGKAIGPTLSRFNNFGGKSAEVTGALADQTRKAYGAVESTVALANAQAGLSASSAAIVSPLIEQRTEIEAGNKAMSEAVDQFQTYQNLRKSGAGAGLTQETGGPFGAGLFGIRSTSQELGRLIGGLPSEAQRTAGDQERTLVGGRFVGTITTPEDAAIQTQVFAEGLEFLNGQLAKGGDSVNRFVDNLSAPELQKSLDAFKAAGANSEALDALRARRIGIADATEDRARQSLKALNVSFQQQAADLILKQLTERQIPAQLFAIRAQGELQRQKVAPTQLALEALAAPRPGIGNVPFSAGLVGVGENGEEDAFARATADAMEAEIGGAITNINKRIEAGQKQLAEWVPPELLRDIQSLGKQISDTQIGVQQAQVNLQVKEYNNQIRIASRSLQDVRDTQSAIKGEVKQTVGGLEGANIALSRQLQLLGFELQQRQINFKLATAGFVAPGTTPEERAARIEAAKLEAAFAQKQLDTQKQIANNQFTSLTLPGIGQIARQIEDLTASIGLLKEGREVVVSTAVASRKIEVLNAALAATVANAGSLISQGVQIEQAAIQTTAQVFVQTNLAFDKLVGKVFDAWGIIGAGAQRIYAFVGGSGGGVGHGRNTQIAGASGLIGDTLGPTNLTVGEAGRETVAVLRNPRLVPSSAFAAAANGGSTGGGALIQMTIIISGNSVREDTDLETLANMVATRTEERLMQKTSLFGLRSSR